MDSGLIRDKGNRLDFVRFFFASLVILSHSFPIATGSEDYEPLALFSNGQLTFGALSVDCFFIVSGYLITQSWVSNPVWSRFLGNRFRRIYPGFIVAAVIGSFILWPLTTTSGYSAISLRFFLEFAVNLLRLQAAAPGPAFIGNPASGILNGSLWSIPYEFWCYIGVMAIGIFGLAHRKYFYIWALVLSTAVSLLFSWKNMTPGGWIFGTIFGYPPFWARLLPYFVAGMVFFIYGESIRLSLAGALFSLILLMIGLKLKFGPIIFLPLMAAYLIFWFSTLPGRWLKRFGKHGDFSYGIYLYSFMVLQLIVYLHGAPMSPWVLFVMAWPVSILCGFLSWRIVERRFVIRKRVQEVSPSLLTRAAGSTNLS